ncbi:MAG: MFS transporter [Rhodobiaceae bacterium]|nr:MFS transporter [Rhodobiaceae bacterium]MCC0057042.1 MFS transporter [Rhodobiaceae bacterium]
MQSLLAAIYPMLKVNYDLTFAQIGLLTFAFQVTASLLQPAIGAYADKRPLTYSLPVGMTFTFCGLFLLAWASHYWMLVFGACLVGMGSAVFHPESSRVARLASGGRHGTAQALFQVGGNVGSAIGPLLAAFIVVPAGQASVAWFSVAALAGMIVLTRVSHWYGAHRRAAAKRISAPEVSPFARRTVVFTLAVLVMLIFSKYVYMASMVSYFTFYLIHKFGLSVQAAQIHLFLFLGAVAFGTLIGGPIGDRIGTKRVIWVSILGVLPFTLALPYADLTWTTVLSMVIGMVLASAFPAIIVFAQELLPGRVGFVAGIFFGLAFGLSGISAAVLGQVADWKGIEYVYSICSFLPAIGLLTVLLPDIRRRAN